jgi:hypothetical protein
MRLRGGERASARLVPFRLARRVQGKQQADVTRPLCSSGEDKPIKCKPFLFKTIEILES